MKNIPNRILVITAFNCLFISTFTLAQSPQFKKEIGTGSSLFFYNSSSPKIQFWYNSTDLQPAITNGIITKIWFRNTTANQTATITNFSLSLKQPTAGTSFTGNTLQTNMKQVFKRSSYSIAGSSVTNGWFAITLDSLFTYTAALPLVCEITCTNVTGSITTLISDAGPQATVGAKKLAATYINATTGVSENNSWQDFGLDFLDPCSFPPVAGQAFTSNTSIICRDSSVTLSLTGINHGVGQQYQWQYASSSSGPFIDTFTQLAYPLIAIQPNTNIWYRCKVTCGGQSSFSTPVFVSVAQKFPAGIYTINASQPSGSGNFQTFTEAVNSIYCGTTGPVTFNVSAGQVFSEVLPSFAALGSDSIPIVFQKFGVGNNPVIVRTDTGVFNSTGLAAPGDGIIVLDGTDNITFDGIDVTALSSGIEYGYFLRKYDSFNGCKNVTIKNCNVTMNRGAKNNIAGIFTSHMDRNGIIYTTGGITVTNLQGRHENITITGNTITNVNYGILSRGPAYQNDLDLYDVSFKIGSFQNGNTISDFNNTSSTLSYAIDVRNVNNLEVSGNNIKNQDQPINSPGNLGGIFIGDGHPDMTGKVFNNRIGLQTNNVGMMTGIYSSYVGKVFIDSNMITLNNTLAASTAFIYISNGKTNSINYNRCKSSSFSSNSDSYLIYNLGADVTSLISNNTFDSIMSNGSGYLYGYYGGSNGSGTEYFLNNTFTNTKAAGIYVGYYSRTNKKKIIRNNTIAFGEASEGLTGIAAYNGIKTISHNKVHNLKLVNSSAGYYILYGITATMQNVADAPDSIYNNIVGDISITSPSISIFLSGIKADDYASATIGKSVLFNNTVYLNTTTAGSVKSIEITNQSPKAKFELKNNIIINNSLGTGTQVISALHIGTTLQNSPNYSSNNNLFYVANLGNNHFIQTHNNVTRDTSLAGIISHFNGNEINSVYEMPHFLSLDGLDTNYLNIDPAIPTQIESGATPITGIKDDINGRLRNIITPDIGAFEINGIPSDFTPPGIYSIITPTICTNGRSITAQISDARGIDTSNGFKPRIWFKKTTENNVLASSNTSAGNGWKWLEANNNSSPFSFFISPAIFTSPLVAGDTIVYFITAQDKSFVPNIAVTGAKLQSPVSTVALSASNFPASDIKYSYAIWPEPSQYTITANRTEVCAAYSAVKLSLNSGIFSGNDFRWQSASINRSNWVDVTGENTDTLAVPALSNSTQYRLIASCSNTPISSSPSNVVSIIVYNPNLISVTPGSRCGAGIVNLSASTSGPKMINWYNQANSFNPLDTGYTFTTPVINTNTTYYAAAAEKGITVQGGLNLPASTLTNTNAGYGLAFTISQPVIINSVNVHSAGGTTISIELYNAAGTILLQSTGVKTVQANTVSTINLGWHLYPGTYRIKTGTLNGAFKRDNGITFPVLLNTFGTIDGYIYTATGSVSTSAYYWFYNWSLTGICVGDKVPVLARIDACCTTNQWLGGVNTAWENPMNWSCGTVPGATDNVIIPAGAVVVISSNVTINNITINLGASVTVSPGFNLIVLH